MISGLCTDRLLGSISGNLERLVLILSTKYFEKWSQSDFTDVNSGRVGGGILFRKFHRRRGLFEFSEITSARYLDLTFVILLRQKSIHAAKWLMVMSRDYPLLITSTDTNGQFKEISGLTTQLSHSGSPPLDEKLSAIVTWSSTRTIK